MWHQALRASAVGIEIVAALAIGYVVGAWLDGKLGTRFLTPVFVLLGAGAGVKALARVAREYKAGPGGEE
jgi:F0F1-type ATP synthase assembly protein I